jgi:hypothetical protein
MDHSPFIAADIVQTAGKKVNFSLQIVFLLFFGCIQLKMMTAKTRETQHLW